MSTNRKTIKLIIDDNILDEYAEAHFLLHPKATKKPIPYPYHESINKWMIMRRPAMNSLKGKWKTFIKWLVEKQGYSNLHINTCEIIQKIYFPTNRRHDLDNTTPKFILDGLVESGMIVDDDCNHVRKLTLLCESGCKKAKTELIIKIIEEKDVV